MPLQFLIPALLRVISTSSSSPAPSQHPASHPLHTLLKPILLTSRAVSQKYNSRIKQLFAEEKEPTDPEEEYIVYAYEKDKLPEDEQLENGADDFEEQERAKLMWIEKFERREYVSPMCFRAATAAPLIVSGPSYTNTFSFPPPRAR